MKLRFRAAGVTCQRGTHTCHMIQVNTPRLNTSQPDRPVLDLPTPEGWKAELSERVSSLLTAHQHKKAIQCLKRIE